MVARFPHLAISLLGTAAWTWIEHIYWLVAILGIPIGTVLGLLELRRIRREQERRPVLAIGFGPFREDQELALEYEAPRPKPGEPIVLPVVTNNKGTLTARELYFNFVFPPTPTGDEFGSPAFDSPTTTPDGRYVVARRLSDGSLFYLVRRLEAVMHPRIYFDEAIPVYVPAGVDEFSFTVILRVADIPETLQTLTVRMLR